MLSCENLHALHWWRASRARCRHAASRIAAAYVRAGTPHICRARASRVRSTHSYAQAHVSISACIVIIYRAARNTRRAHLAYLRPHAATYATGAVVNRVLRAPPARARRALRIDVSAMKLPAINDIPTLPYSVSSVIWYHTTLPGGNAAPPR